MLFKNYHIDPVLLVEGALEFIGIICKLVGYIIENVCIYHNII